MTSVTGALQLWVAKIGRNPKGTYVWICAMCLNQHRIVNAITSQQLASEFGTRVRAIGYILPMLEPWRQPTFLTRAWCLFELYVAHIPFANSDTSVNVYHARVNNMPIALAATGADVCNSSCRVSLSSALAYILSMYSNAHTHFCV